ncbi:MAG TPA: methyl-accepting chemotaxis protein [Proteobacteria bacterium]|nr:methyl-accepting chemotaxis protein [Pseudomonadota bacterium]
MKSLSIKTKLGLSLGGLILIVVVMFLQTLNTTRGQKHDGLLINLAGRQRMLTQKMTKEALHLFLARGATRTEILPKLTADLKNTMAVFEQTLTALKDSGRAPLTLDLDKGAFRDCPKAEEPAYSQLAKVEELKNAFFANLDLIISNSGDTQKNLQAVLSDNLPLLQEMNKAVGMMQKQSENRVRQLLLSQMIGLAAGAALFIGAFLLAGSIVRRIAEIGRFADRLGTGDFSVNAAIAGNDELGAIGRNLHAMVRNLAQMFATVKEKTTSLHQLAAALEGIADKIAAEAWESAERSRAVSAAAEEMNVNFSSINDAVERTSANIGRVSNAAESMTGTIAEIAGNSSRARQITLEAVKKSKASGEKVKELNQAAIAIGNVSETITAIAAQTNLLALNATIEAARAGEAGRGFTVVANEIKALAMQTAGATDEITAKVRGIQGFTEVTKQDIVQISEIIKEINNLVNEIATAVNEQSQATQEIADSVSESSQEMADVNDNISQGSQVATEVAKDISAVSHSANELDDGGRELLTFSKQLSKLADQFNSSMNQFKLTS